MSILFSAVLRYTFVCIWGEGALNDLPSIAGGAGQTPATAARKAAPAIAAPAQRMASSNEKSSFTSSPSVFPKAWRDDRRVSGAQTGFFNEGHEVGLFSAFAPADTDRPPRDWAQLNGIARFHQKLRDSCKRFQGET